MSGPKRDHPARPQARLKLAAIRDQLDGPLDEAARREPSPRETVARLCEREIARQDERRIGVAMSIAKFPFVRDLAGFDFRARPSLDPRRVRAPATGRSIANGEAVLLLGPPGAGARRTSRWRSGARRSGARRSAPATRCCSSRRRRWWRRSPRPTPTGAWRTSSPGSPSPSC